MSKFFVTTPIYYINDQPHNGSAYPTIAADVLARYHRDRGDEVLFTTGTDENSQKTFNAAEAKGQGLSVYTDELAKVWRKTFDQLNISYDRFIRTTEAEHRRAVEHLISQIDLAGDIYKGSYEGLYCVGHEAFMKPDELVDGMCPDHQTVPDQIKEDNYFFKLSKYQERLLEHIEQHPEFIQPETRRNEVLAFLKSGLDDISVSRPKQQWGIPFPGDDGQVVYVWFDALINYLTVTGYPDETFKKWWPVNYHIIGKDIIRFHCVIWPAMLLSAGIKLPKSVFAHGFFTIDGQKISKSLGNAINPLELAAKYGNDALRYYLLREIPFGGDGDFSHERFESVYNSDLANELGNLVQRLAAMIERYFEGKLPPISKKAHDLTAYHQAVSELRFDLALTELWREIKGLNQYIEEEKPWQLAKTDPTQLAKVLGHALVDLQQVNLALKPFLPETAEKIDRTFAGGKVDASVGLLFPKADALAHKKLNL